ncbi:MAG: molybdenum cofactor biosynthesis protein MoaE [Rhodospirillaceae bacterium]|nr:molybdenum cofactor biosynthesis protein MoaE [Rhodospirillaceae bacterium]
MIRIQTKDFDAGAEIKNLVSGKGNIGGVCSFIGLVRDFSASEQSGEKITAMTLEHYPAMTEKQLEKIETQAQERWGSIETLIIHRVGRLEPTAQIVLVAVAAAHRDVAFEAARFIMDILKTEAPFWKKEEGPTTSKWVEAKASDIAKAGLWEKK